MSEMSKAEAQANALAISYGIALAFGYLSQETIDRWAKCRYCRQNTNCQGYVRCPTCGGPFVSER